MTSGLDIVTNDAGEFVRAAHARDSGEEVLISLHRLASMVRMHDTDNQAFLRQLEQTHKAVLYYCLHAGRDLVVLFADRVVLIGGQLLRGSRTAYEAATELGERFMWCGGAELTVQKDVQQKDLRAFAEALAIAMRSKRSEEFKSPTPKIRLRAVSEAVRVRGLNIERMNYEQKLVRTYASAVVVMRRFFEAMRAGRYVLPKRLKRIAQGLVDLSEGRAASFLGVTEVRNANHDDAGRAVNTAIIAVAAARQLTSDRPTLSQLAMAALLFDAGRPRAESKLPKGGIVAAKLSDADEDCMPAGAAVVLTALGRLNEPTIARTVLTFESLWLKRARNIGPVYGGKLEATIQARLITVARRYNDLLTPEPGLNPPTPDYAIGVLSQECTDQLDQHVLRMLVAALGLLPAGTRVKLSSGETAEIIATEERPAGERPRVKLIADSRGKPIKPPRLLDLAEPPKGRPAPEIASVLSTDGWKAAAAQAKALVAPQADYDADEAPEPEPPRASIAAAAPPRAESVAAPARPSEPTPSFDDDGDLAFEAEGEPEAQLEAVDEEEPESMQSGVGGPPSASLSFSIGWNGPPPPSAAAMGRSPVSVPPRQAPQLSPPQRPAPAPEPEDAGEEHTVYEASPYGAEEQSDEVDDGESTQYFPGGIRAQVANLEELVPPVDPSATGNLKGTPLPNVLVYMLDRALTGTLILRAPDGKAHALYFDGGAPAKLRMGHPIAPLSEELLAARLTVPQAIEACASAAEQARMPLADFLRAQKLVPEDGLANALRQQLLHRIEWLVKLPEETTYGFYQDYNALEHWGGEGVGEYEPLDVILAANRVWKNHARIISTLTKIGENPIVLHPEADLSGLSLTRDEQSLLDMIRARPSTMAELYNQYSVSDKVVSTMLYTLLITRQLMLPGQARPPMKPRRSAVRPTMPARPRPASQPAQVQSAPVSAPRVSPVPPEPVPASARRATVPERPQPAASAPVSARTPNPPAAAPPRASFAGTDPDSARRALGLAPTSAGRAVTPQRPVVVPDPAEAAAQPAVSITDARTQTAEAAPELEEDDSRQSYPSFASFQNFGAGPSSGGPASVGIAIASTPPSSSGTPVPADSPPRSKLSGKPAAKGDLVVTPMVHILVYMLDHAATGTVQLLEPDGTEHLIAFRDGVPNRMKTGRPVELLGQLLVEAGLLASGAVDNALREAKQIDAPLGEYLVLHEVIKRQQLDVVLQVQLLRKFAALANLPPETTYAFYRDVNALDDWGGKSPVRVDPLQVLLETVRAWYDRHRIRGTLFRMKDRTLVLCTEGNTTALREDPSAKAVIEAIESGGMNILTLYRKRIADEEDVNSVVYTLAVTRHFTFASQKGPPMGTGPRTA